MLARQQIRSQMFMAAVVLFITVFVLSLASLQGVLKFRRLTKSIKERATELPLAAELSQKISDLESTLLRGKSELAWSENQAFTSELGETLKQLTKNKVDQEIVAVEQALQNYRHQLINSQTLDPRIADNHKEIALVEKFQLSLDEIRQTSDEGDWMMDQSGVFNSLPDKIDQLQSDATRLPGMLQQRMNMFSEQARREYHAWIAISAGIFFGAVLVIAFIYRRFHVRILRPLETLVHGSRLVAAGDFDHRIKLATNDEVAELAEALNAMTENFQAIKSDLNQQVKERTKEVVRSEKMASVGFLAAGVAHEINNPLASIAWSAESLESRIQDILNPSQAVSPSQLDSEIDGMKKYLRRIQDEAFRCKGITAGLLDFSRMGDAEKVTTNLHEVVESVLEIVRPLGKYREKNLHFDSDSTVRAKINPQEIKQVMMNLVTNALDSVSDGGVVKIQLKKSGTNAVLIVSDNGCGMTDEVKKHLFEPFFTRRRDGQGTGLGLSITYQIIEDHGGRITPHSDGPGKGSSFTISMPLVKYDQQKRAA